MTLEEMFDSETEDNRDKVMSYIDGYYNEPTDVINLSDRMEEMLKFDSDYMTQAGDASEEAARESGMLESGFNRGTGYVEAIDRSAFVAQEDAYTDSFNAQLDNERDWLNYQAAWEASAEQQWYEGNLDYAEMVKDFEKYSSEAQQEWESLYADKVNQFNITLENNRQLFDLENMSKRNEYYVDRMDYTQNLDMISTDTEFGYQRDLIKTQQEGITQRTEESIDFYDQLFFAKIQTLEGQSYLETITKLNLSDLYDEEKGDQMEGLISAMNGNSSSWKSAYPEFSHLVNTQWSYDAGSELYRWDDSDVDKYWGQMSDIVNDIDLQIHEETTRVERDQMDSYRTLEYVRDEFPSYKETYPIAANKIMQWYATVGSKRWNDDDVEQSWIYVINTMSELMQGMKHLDTGGSSWEGSADYNEDVRFDYDFDIESKTVTYTPVLTMYWMDEPIYATPEQVRQKAIEDCLQSGEATADINCERTINDPNWFAEQGIRLDPTYMYLSRDSDLGVNGVNQLSEEQRVINEIKFEDMYQ